ncbi:MAG: hypothetical protein L6Q71_05700, partial [Planctomycetes bacterium]|nr:hypothetical protein [Planctomycetota bacterium]
KRKYPLGVSEEEQDKWPLEIIVLMDDERYQAYGKDAMGGALPPGARAHYSPTYRQVITWDDPQSEFNKETQWFDRSVIIHEAWHFISSIYMDERKTFKDPKSGKNEGLPGYSSLLIQEGLTDMVAGFETDGENYTFRKQNHARLDNLQEATRAITAAWKTFTEQHASASQKYTGEEYQEGKWASCFDMRGVVIPNAYPFCQHATLLSLRRWGMDRHPISYGCRSAATGMYYAAGCLTSYFFHMNDKYRDKFYQWCCDDYHDRIDKNIGKFIIKYYNGEIDVNHEHFTSLPGFTSFCKIFGLNGWDDPKWHEMTDEFLDWMMKLEPVDIGKGFEVDDLNKDGGNGNEDGFNDARSYSFGGIAFPPLKIPTVVPPQAQSFKESGQTNRRHAPFELPQAAFERDAILRPVYTRLTRRPSPQLTA